MDRRVKTLGWVALVPASVLAAGYAWKAFSPAMAEQMPDITGTLQERAEALRNRLDRSGASELTKKMLQHDEKALKYAKAGEANEWKAVQARLSGSRAVISIGDRFGVLRSNLMARQARQDARKARQHALAAMKLGGEAEKLKWQAVSGWLRETGAMLRRWLGDVQFSPMNAATVDGAQKRARSMWAEYGWGAARAEREASKRRNNIAVGLAAGLGLGAGAMYLVTRARGSSLNLRSLHAGTPSPDATRSNGGESVPYMVDRAMRATERAFDNTTGASGGAPARELGTNTGLHNTGQQASGVQNTYATAAPARGESGEGWIVIPKEQWAEFIRIISDRHEGWRVRVETEGNLSVEGTPLEDARFNGMQLEPSMARPGVRMYVGSLPGGFFEHVIPDLRTVEHLPSDEDGYQALRFDTTVDRVTVRFTDPGDARDPLAE